VLHIYIYIYDISRLRVNWCPRCLWIVSADMAATAWNQ